MKAPLLRARANDVGDPELLDVAGDPKQLVKLIALDPDDDALRPPRAGSG